MRSLEEILKFLKSERNEVIVSNIDSASIPYFSGTSSYNHGVKEIILRDLEDFLNNANELKLESREDGYESKIKVMYNSSAVSIRLGWESNRWNILSIDYGLFLKDVSGLRKELYNISITDPSSYLVLAFGDRGFIKANYTGIRLFPYINPGRLYFAILPSLRKIFVSRESEVKF